MPCDLPEEVSTLSSSTSGLSYFGGFSHDNFFDNNHMTPEDHYCVPGDEASDVGVAWPEYHTM
jgi:hypothetical protein